MGNPVVTTLDRDNGLLRYDLKRPSPRPRACGCGETTIRLVGGRFGISLSIVRASTSRSAVENALRTVDEVSKPTLEYVVVKPTESAAPLRIRVELLDGDTDLARGRCIDAIKQRVGIDADVEIVDRESLARSGYKAVRLVDA